MSLISKKLIVFILMGLFAVGAYFYYAIPHAVTFRKSLSIVKQRWIRSKTKPLNIFPSLNIKLPQKSFEILEKDRVGVLNHGVLSEKYKNYVPAKLGFKNKEYDIKIRLKGNLRDHWEDAVLWSFKVNMMDNSLEEVKYFGLLHPSRRGNITEWLYHQMMKFAENNYLAYQFVELTINEMYYGTYAMEEGWGSFLTETDSNGLVLKWDLKNYYDTIDIKSYFKKNDAFEKNNPEKRGKISDEVYYNSPIIAYKNGQNINLEYAINLLNDFRNQKKKTSEVFDMDKLATTISINSLFGNQHPLYINNVRFYFNPETMLFEIIPYDLERIHLLEEQESYEKYHPWKVSGFMPQHIFNLFKDTVFREIYIKKQISLADPIFINSFFLKIDEEYNEVVGKLKKSGIKDFDIKQTIRHNSKFILDNNSFELQ